jgi:hypothetical protein
MISDADSTAASSKSEEVREVKYTGRGVGAFVGVRLWAQALISTNFNMGMRATITGLASYGSIPVRLAILWVMAKIAAAAARGMSLEGAMGRLPQRAVGARHRMGKVTWGGEGGGQ